MGSSTTRAPTPEDDAREVERAALWPGTRTERVLGAVLRFRFMVKVVEGSIMRQYLDNIVQSVKLLFINMQAIGFKKFNKLYWFHS
jgi:hypothetical protein